MNPKTPKVSIIMATYNRAHFIVETLHAIQKQTYTNWECLIVDDGGDDNTQEVIASILEADNRFQFSKRPSNYGKGLPGCRNYGIDSASGDFIIFFDDDDIPHPQNLEHCTDELSDLEYQFCRYKRSVFHGDFSYNFDETDPYETFTITNADLPMMIDHRLPFNSCAVMWRKSCFDGNKFNEALMYAEEWECYSRILSEEIKGISIEKVLFYGRKHAASNTGEFWNHNPVRLNSKKEAIRLIADNLASKNIFTPYMLKYLSGMAMVFKDRELLNYILAKSKAGIGSKMFVHFKYWVFPHWKWFKSKTK